MEDLAPCIASFRRDHRLPGHPNRSRGAAESGHPGRWRTWLATWPRGGRLRAPDRYRLEALPGARRGEGRAGLLTG